MPGGDGCGLCHSGSLAMGMMFDSRNIPDDLMTTVSITPFRSWASITTWVILYGDLCHCEYPGTSSCAGILDYAPLKVLLGDADSKYIPASLVVPTLLVRPLMAIF